MNLPVPSLRLPVPLLRWTGSAGAFRLGILLCSLTVFPATAHAEDDFQKSVLPVLRKHCLDCHSEEKQKGDLDLERFRTVELVRAEPALWEHVIEQIQQGEMPPKDQPALQPDDRRTLLRWITGTLEDLALAQAGDPGPVVLRRLSNTDYTWTLRDLTGIPTLDPAREFPIDGAAGEGFTNAGSGLVMSPALVTKYMDAAREVAAHAVLLPGRIAFSPSTSTRDQADAALAAIRKFYDRYSVPGGGSAVNLQGLQFHTSDGGILPLERYLASLLTHRGALQDGSLAVEEAARRDSLSPKYLARLWNLLAEGSSNPLVSAVIADWTAAAPSDADALAARILPWQKVLWRFTQVGHIGKRDGPPAWQVPLTPLADSVALRQPFPPPGPDGMSRLHLVVSEAGDGPGDDIAAWNQTRVVWPGGRSLPLPRIPAALETLTNFRDRCFASTAAALSAVAERFSATSPAPVSTQSKPGPEPAQSESADAASVEPQVLGAWLHLLGWAQPSGTLPGPLLTRQMKATPHPGVSGWTGDGDLSVVANSSRETVHIPGRVEPARIAVHPAPDRQLVAAFSVRASGSMQVSGTVCHAHPACGNGVWWTVEWRRGTFRRVLATGQSNHGQESPIQVPDAVAVQPGDLITLAIAPGDGNHSCDLTLIDLRLVTPSSIQDLAADTAKDIGAGNPHPSGWMFFSEPAAGAAPAAAVFPERSLLSRWIAASSQPELQAPLAAALQNLLIGPEPADPSHPDARLRQQLLSAQSPLLEIAWNELSTSSNPANPAEPIPPLLQTPGVQIVSLPGEWATGAVLETIGSLAASAGPQASVQMQILSAPPLRITDLIAGDPLPPPTKTVWSAGDQSGGSSLPVLVRPHSEGDQRMRQFMQEFRELFPAALCYRKIVPVDEVVTLTLHYREDDALCNLLLGEAEKAELNRLWAELRWITQEPLKLVDAFEQLWQFATQDADPSAFEPMREPIRRGAAAFREAVTAAEPVQVRAAVDFTASAWRRPLSPDEENRLLDLYASLREAKLSHEDSIRLMITRILVAPAFLYRSEQCAQGQRTAAVNDWELASRLGFFLWSSGPDSTLRELAAAGRLHDPETLREQARRMIRDPRIRRMATEFGTQWLHIRDLDTLDEKSERHFPEFKALRADLLEEAVLFLTHLFQENAPVMSLVDADHTWVSPTLAAFYGLPSGVVASSPAPPGSAAAAPDWQRIHGLREVGRGGLLGWGAVLAKQSGASRTSPILRGNWLSEVVLGEKLPRPPKGVPVLPEETPEGLTERQLTERHRSDPQCATCHLKIDPPGFALEGFDAIGRARTVDAAGLRVDTRATLPDGTLLEGLSGLRAWLNGPRQEDFRRQFCRKLLGYALGRAVQLSDRPLLDRLVRMSSTPDAGAASLVEEIICSPQFLQARGSAWPSP